MQRHSPDNTTLSSLRSVYMHGALLKGRTLVHLNTQCRAIKEKPYTKASETLKIKLSYKLFKER